MRLRRVMREPVPRPPRTPVSLRTLSLRIQASRDLAHHFIRRAAALPNAAGGRASVPLEALKDALTFFDLPADTVDALRAAAQELGLRDRDYMRRLLSERSLRLLAKQPVEALRPVPPVSELEKETPEVTKLVAKLGERPNRIQIDVPNELLKDLNEKAMELGGITLPATIVTIAEDHLAWLSLDPLQIAALEGEAAGLGINPRDYMRAVFALEGMRLRLSALGAEHPKSQGRDD